MEAAAIMLQDGQQRDLVPNKPANFLGRDTASDQVINFDLVCYLLLCLFICLSRLVSGVHMLSP